MSGPDVLHRSGADFDGDMRTDMIHNTKIDIEYLCILIYKMHIIYTQYNIYIYKYALYIYIYIYIYCDSSTEFALHVLLKDYILTGGFPSS